MQFLADVLKKTSTSMFPTMFEKTQNIMLTMHISDVFLTIRKKQKILHIFYKYQLQSFQSSLDHQSSNMRGQVVPTAQSL